MRAIVAAVRRPAAGEVDRIKLRGRSWHRPRLHSPHDRNFPLPLPDARCLWDLAERACRNMLSQEGPVPEGGESSEEDALESERDDLKAAFPERRRVDLWLRRERLRETKF